MSMMRGMLMPALLACAVSAGAQAPARIAWILSTGLGGTCVAAFKDGMREHGLLEGEHYVMDQRSAEGNYDRFPALIDEVLQRVPAVIIGSTIASVRAAQQATQTVPILFSGVNDPVGSGLVRSLARPEGNTTGLSNQAEDLMAKYMQLLRQVLPRAKRVAVLYNPSNESHPKMLDTARVSAAKLGITIQSFAANAPSDLDAALGAIARFRPDALMPIRDAMLNGEIKRIAAFALEQRLPTFAGRDDLVEAGSLISYAAPLHTNCRRTAYYVKRILEGTKPSDLPVEQPATFELVINMKTARALGLTIPQSVLLRADRVVE